MIAKLHKKCLKLSSIKFSITMLLASFLIVVAIGLVTTIIAMINGQQRIIEKVVLPKNDIWGLMVSLILAPIIETLFDQLLVIKLSRFIKVFKKHPSLSILLSAIIFGLGHSYSTLYIIQTFFVGIIFAYVYVFFEKRYDDKHAFLALSGIHSLRNLISNIVKYVLF
ncbi:MAG: CPBP family intramembrane metalloprotease [Bacteriovoracaceae bacterium]|nr:CPBP family intramembrane metalloprotease [Bacteriovoracaceae bacterium]